MSWQKKLTQGFSSAAELLAYLELPTQDLSLAERIFPSRIPLGFAARMQKGNPQDPLLLQVLAQQDELKQVVGYVEDPLAEKQNNPLNGLIHKYHGRVLLTLAGVCAVNCRYCFRRHFPYQDNNPGALGWQKVISYIEADESISEVILSGGDPLMVSNVVLERLLKQFEAIPHVHTVRIHTRMPIVLPERIDAEFLALLSTTQLNKVIVVHANHAQELNDEVAVACEQLRQSGCYILNQSVLLAGVNDDASILASLSQKLFACGIIPYYLHLLDKVCGSAHFEVSSPQAIYNQLKTLLPGYLLPRLVREEPGEKSKTLVFT